VRDRVEQWSPKLTSWQNSTFGERIRPGVRACLVLAIALPPLFVATLYAFYFRAWLVLGHAPWPYHPDPKSFPFQGHRWLVLITAIQMLISPLALLAVVLFRPLTRREHVVVQRVGVAFATLYVLTIAFVRADPFRVLEWFLD
jgi:hypothetical protein